MNHLAYVSCFGDDYHCNGSPYTATNDPAEGGATPGPVAGESATGALHAAALSRCICKPAARTVLRHSCTAASGPINTTAFTATWRLTSCTCAFAATHLPRTPTDSYVLADASGDYTYPACSAYVEDWCVRMQRMRRCACGGGA